MLPKRSLTSPRQARLEWRREECQIPAACFVVSFFSGPVLKTHMLLFPTPISMLPYLFLTHNIHNSAGQSQQGSSHIQATIITLPNKDIVMTYITWRLTLVRYIKQNGDTLTEHSCLVSASWLLHTTDDRFKPYILKSEFHFLGILQWWR